MSLRAVWAPWLVSLKERRKDGSGGEKGGREGGTQGEGEWRGEEKGGREGGRKALCFIIKYHLKCSISLGCFFNQPCSHSINELNSTFLVW